MTITTLHPEAVPRSPFYAQGAAIDGGQRLVAVAGQVGVDAAGVPAEGVAAQARQAIANVNSVLAEAGLGPESIVKQTIYLTDPTHVEEFVGAAAENLSADPPPATMLIVNGLAGPDLLVEIEVWAAG